VAAHVVGGGSAPDTVLTLLLTVLLAWAGITLAGRRRSATAIGAALAGSQLALHVLFTGLGGHQHGRGSLLAAAHPAAMTAAHVLATVLTALVLAKAESAVFAAAAALAALLPRRVSPPPVRTPPRAAPGPCIAPRPVLDVLLRTVIARRGPPVCS
jgi:hypothetical protein